MATREPNLTEAEWLRADNPQDLLRFLDDGPTTRKHRLLMCACLRRIWSVLHDDRLRSDVETSERFADGNATAAELEMARRQAKEMYEGIGDIIEDHGSMAVELVCSSGLNIYQIVESVASVAAEASDENWDLTYSRVQAAQAALIREVIGNPFRPVTVDPAWLRWNGGSVPKIAQMIYDKRAFDRLPKLHDALLEAGCADDQLLTHCLQAEGHVRGCWALDLVRSVD